MKRSKVLLYIKTETFADFFLLRYFVIFLLRWKVLKFTEWCYYSFDKETLFELMSNREFNYFYKQNETNSALGFEHKLTIIRHGIDDYKLRTKLYKIIRRL